MENQKFCLKWNNFQNSVTSVFENLRQDEELVDITLCCEGHKIKAHRMMLSACSPYFRDLLKENPCQHPVFFLKDTSYPDLAAVVEFVYKGEVNVAQSQLASFLKTAEMLQVRGLTGEDDDEAAAAAQQVSKSGSTPRASARPAATSTPSQPSRPTRPASPPVKRRRLSGSPERPTASQPLPLPPPPPPPPVSTPPVPLPAELAARLPADRPPAAAAADNDQSHPPPPLQQQLQQQQQQQQDFNIKVEKVDLADEDDESLEATFSHVSNFEASQFDGSNQSAASHDMSGLLSRVTDQGMGDLSAMAGTSEDGAQQQGAMAAAGRTFRCPVCSREYTNHRSLDHHMHVHTGKTTCLVCGSVYGRIGTLRNHVLQRHPEAAHVLAQLLPGGRGAAAGAQLDYPPASG